MEEFFGEPIYSYTAQDAIDDGILTHPYPEDFEGLLLSINVAAVCNPEGKPWEEPDVKERFTELLRQALIAVSGKYSFDPIFKKIFYGEKVYCNTEIAGDLVIGGNELDGPTICQPCED